ncbi:DUF883 domain-containing protein [Alteromonas gracilis]|uniref:DUF883 domain-containing protein n=1 Tax=Alteromonas gracilis TaxID=1479524 RepID=UPI0030CBD48F
MATQTTNKSQANKSNGATAPGHPLTDSMQASLHASVDKLADSAGIVEENLRKTATSSAENMSARKRLAEKKWHASKVRAYAVENPVATAGIAFAAGMLATALFRKK